MEAKTTQPPRASPYPRIGESRLAFRGLPRAGWRDAYHLLLNMPLAAFFAVMAVAFLLINGVFGLLYYIDPGGVSGARSGSYADAFFFSVQTLATLGYGVMAPKSLFTNLVVTAEVFLGLFNLAIATGLLFARISRPTARIMFSDKAVITDFDGAPALMFRAANRRRNLVVEADVSVSLLKDVRTAEGVLMRRFDDLPTLRGRTPLFFLTWTVIHRIDETSPLFGKTREELLADRSEILVIIKGLDETFVSTIHARASYQPDEIVWGGKLADIFSYGADGRFAIDFRRFHEVVDA
jgi:inward rectifier potassium channel